MSETTDKKIELPEDYLKDIDARNFYFVNESEEDITNLKSINPGPQGINPEQIYKIYNFDKCFMGEGQTIVIVCAFNYPTALQDFNIFSEEFGLPLESSTNVLDETNKVFQIINAKGVTPADNIGWAFESSLDVQWAHAMAPLAKIVLVQAASNSYYDLFQAIAVANLVPGAHVISMSWGGYEFSGQTIYDIYFRMPGMTYVAASGDAAANPLYPATSQYVLSVGGTKLNFDSFGKFISEVAWADGGCGPSKVIAIPFYQLDQKAVAAKCGNYLGTPDVAFDADPVSAVSVYNSATLNGTTGWRKIAGTSVGAPSWAGIIACINGARVKPLDTTVLQELIYGLSDSKYYTRSFNDIISGKDGPFYCSIGWDLVTGWGTPNIKNLIQELICKQ